MHALIHDLGGVVDQLNPLSRQNQIVYLVWLAGYVFAAGAVWRCSRRWARLIFLILLQVLSVGLFISQANILVLLIYLWRESLALAIVVLLLAVLAFRTRRRKTIEGASARPAEGGAPTLAAPDRDVAGSRLPVTGR